MTAAAEPLQASATNHSEAFCRLTSFSCFVCVLWCGCLNRPVHVGVVSAGWGWIDARFGPSDVPAHVEGVGLVLALADLGHEGLLVVELCAQTMRWYETTC